MLFNKVLAPMATFPFPDILFFSENLPIAVLFDPVWFASNASCPIATFSSPSILLTKAPDPNATL